MYCAPEHIHIQDNSLHLESEETMDVIIAMTEMQKAQEDLHKTQKEKIQSIQQMYQNALEAHEEARITNMKYETAFEDAKAAEKHMEYVKDILWTTQLTLK